VFGLGKVKGKHTGVERAAFSECSITSHHTLFPSPSFSRTFCAHLFANNLLYYVGVGFGFGLFYAAAK
jgi:hypothetical protein